MSNPWLKWSKRRKLRIIVTVISVFISGTIIGVSISQREKVPPSISYTKFKEQLASDKVKQVMISFNFITAMLTNGEQVKTKIDKDWENPITELEKHKVHIEFQESKANYKGLLIALSIVFTVVIWAYFFSRGIHPTGEIQLKFWQSRRVWYAKGKSKITFADVAGIDEAKAELQEIVEFLKDPPKYQRLGGRVPRGVLLVGPPGTGKTLLARAVAGEADVPFRAMSGSDFVEIYVGVGASRVRSFCDKGKEMGRCILFIDEIDALGGKRRSPTSGGDREYQQTLNALLVEMDGFERSPGVVFIGATNSPEILDEALIRPGRFDSRVYVPLPDKRGRKAILQVHVRKQKVILADDINLEAIAQATQGLSGADLENLVNQAAIIALGDIPERNQVAQKDFIRAKDKVLLGPENKSRKRREEDLKTSMHHEAGHALVAALLQHARPIEKATIVSRGKTGGGVYFLQEEDDQMREKEQLITELAVLMSGRVAEQQFLGTVTSGAENDISVATDLAKNMVCRWGMSELGPIAIGVTPDSSSHLTGVLSETKKQKVDEAIDKFIKDAETTAGRILGKYSYLYRQIVNLLGKEETVDGQDIYNIVGNLKGSEKA